MKSLLFYDCSDSNELNVKVYGNKQRVIFTSKNIQSGENVEIDLSHEDTKKLINLLKTNKY